MRMRPGYRIGSVRGIPIRIHYSMLLVLPLIAFAMGSVMDEAARVAEIPPEQLVGSSWMWGLGVAVALFASVLVHELAHSLYAIAKGGKVKGITLMIIGGVSQLSEPPRRPREEAIMAAAGPLTSFGLSALFFGAWMLLREVPLFSLRFAVFQLFYLNAILAVFNLIPAFPMDGGRILRASLAPRMGLERATHTAAVVGRVFAVAFGLLGVLAINPILILIAVFIWMGARAEARQVTTDALLDQLKIRDVMTPNVEPISARASLRDAAARMLSSRLDVVPVATESGRPAVVALEAIRQRGDLRDSDLTVADLQVETPDVAPDDALLPAFRRIAGDDLPGLAVASHGSIVGVVTWEGIAHAARRKQVELEMRTRAGTAGWSVPQERDTPT